MLKLRFVSEDELTDVAELASSIWHEYFPCILTEGQIDYMVERFQSYEAMLSQTREKGYMYAYLEDDGIIKGYTALCPEGKKLFISKLYLLKEERGKGYGSMAIKEIFAYASKNNHSSLYLTVNKFNDKAIKAYERNGFEKIQSICTDIGDGYVMDDYVMEKVL